MAKCERSTAVGSASADAVTALSTFGVQRSTLDVGRSTLELQSLVTTKLRPPRVTCAFAGMVDAGPAVFPSITSGSGDWL